MNEKPEGPTRKHVRVVFPAHVEFAGEKFTIDEFTADLSEGGVFLLTERHVTPGTRGKLTFRISQWEEPFTVEAVVVWHAPPGDTGPGTSGLGLRFVDLGPLQQRKLQRLIEGVRDGSVVEAIRRSIREQGTDLVRELRRRPTDQKMILALNARRDEFDALIRDGNPLVLERLLSNPRLIIPDVRKIARDTRASVRLLLAIHRQRDWMDDEEVRYLFAKHPNAPRREALRTLERLTRLQLVQIAQNPNAHPEIRTKAKALAGRLKR